MKYYFISYRFGDYGYGNTEIASEFGIRSFDDLNDIRDMIKTNDSKIKDNVIIMNFIELRNKSKSFKLK